MKLRPRSTMRRNARMSNPAVIDPSSPVFVENTFSMLTFYHGLPSCQASRGRCICSTGHGSDLAQHYAVSSKMRVANAHSLAVEVAPYGT